MKQVWQVWEEDYESQIVLATYDNEEEANKHLAALTKDKDSSAPWFSVECEDIFSTYAEVAERDRIREEEEEAEAERKAFEAARLNRPKPIKKPRVLSWSYGQMAPLPNVNELIA